MTIEQPTTPPTFPSVVPVWILMALGAVLVGVFAPSALYLTWIPLVLAAGIFVTFCVQLALVHKEGLVVRVMASLGGSLVILTVASAILSALALGSA